tara:strand:+ start:3275 stop:4012 length:738 start_codon:yes stop_codon:yes gene_type:complete
MKILVIGESCKDVYQYGDCVRLCPEAPVPVFQSNRHKTVNGGMAMNVYNNVSSLCKYSVVLVTNKNWSEISKTRLVDFRTNCIVLRLDENDDDYKKSDIKEIKFEDYDAVIISDYNKGYLSESDIEYISSQHPTTFLDTKKILGTWCRNVKFIKINEFEYERTHHRLEEAMIDKMIITLGPNGARYRDEIYKVPKVEIKDTSGAGDTFISGLVVKYVESGDIGTAIKYANECATAVVQKKGVTIV